MIISFQNQNSNFNFEVICNTSNGAGFYESSEWTGGSMATISATVADVAGNSTTVSVYTYTCFVAGTKVLTENGLKNIEDIQIGEKVYTINLDTNEKELKEVTKLINGHSSEIYEITIGNTLIETTPKHQFYVEGKGWVRACDLEEGEELIALKTGEKMTVSSIKHVYYEEPVAVYNLTVENNHNYLITEYNVLVHNAPEAC